MPSPKLRPRKRLGVNLKKSLAPGVYKPTDEIIREAALAWAEESPALREVFGTSREELLEKALLRQGQGNAQWTKSTGSSAPSESVLRVMSKENTERLQEIADAAMRHPRLREGAAWYIGDPAYERLAELVGPEEAARRFQRMVDVTSAYSPMSDVEKELVRSSYPLSAESRGFSIQDYVNDPYLIQKEGGPGTVAGVLHSQLLKDAVGESGVADRVKVGTYSLAKGVPQTRFDTRYGAGDRHFVKGVGLADTRATPSIESIAESEAAYIYPWFDQTMQAVGLRGGTGQPLLWGVLGPQTGLKSQPGKPFLEIMADLIKRTAAKEGLPVEQVRDEYLTGKRVLKGTAAGAVGLGALAESDEAEAAWFRGLPKPGHAYKRDEIADMKARRAEAAERLSAGEDPQDVLDATGWELDIIPRLRGPDQPVVLTPADLLGEDPKKIANYLAREVPTWGPGNTERIREYLAALDPSQRVTTTQGPTPWAKIYEKQMDHEAFAALRGAPRPSYAQRLGDMAELPNIYREIPALREAAVYASDAAPGMFGRAIKNAPSRGIRGGDEGFLSFDWRPVEELPDYKKESPFVDVWYSLPSLSHELDHWALATSTTPKKFFYEYGHPLTPYLERLAEVRARAAQLRAVDASEVPDAPRRPLLDIGYELYRAAQDKSLTPFERMWGRSDPRGSTLKEPWRFFEGGGQLQLPFPKIVPGAAAGAVGFGALAESNDAGAAELRRQPGALAETDDAGVLRLDAPRPENGYVLPGSPDAESMTHKRPYVDTYVDPDPLGNLGKGVLAGVVGAIPDLQVMTSPGASLLQLYAGGESPDVIGGLYDALGGDERSTLGTLGQWFAPFGTFPNVRRAVVKGARKLEDAVKRAGSGVEYLRGKPHPGMSPGEFVATSEYVPGYATGHMVDETGKAFADQPARLREAYTLMQGPRAGEPDPFYAALGYEQLPWLRGVGRYTNTAGKVETNPLVVWRVKSEPGPMTSKEKEDTSIVEMWRGLTTAQEASAGHKLTPVPFWKANAASVQGSLPGYADPRFVEPIRQKASKKGIDWIDRGDGRFTFPASFDPVPAPGGAAKAAWQGALKSDAFPQVSARPALFESTYEAIPWTPRTEQGTGRATQAAVEAIQRSSSPQRFWQMLEDPKVRELQGRLAQNDDVLASSWRMSPRDDLQRLRHLLSTGTLRAYISRFGYWGLPVLATVAALEGEPLPRQEYGGLPLPAL